MAIRRFDEPALLRALHALAPPVRVAFAAACAQRLSGAANAFWKDSPSASRSFDERLRAVWTSVASVAAGAAEPAALATAMQHAKVCEELSGDAEDADSEAAPYAADASAALAYAWRCLARGGECQEAAWAARRAYEAVNTVAVNSGLPADGRPENEARIDATRWVQNELERQARDLDVLRSVEPRAAIETLRRAAEAIGRSGWPTS